MTYQIKLKVLTEVLKRDHDFLKKMTQPNQVKEQLAQLYRELEETGELFFVLSFLNLFFNFSIFFLGEAIKPLLETDLTTSCTSSSSYSAGEESEDTYINNQKQRQVHNIYTDKWL